MMKIAVISYSLTGNNQVFAKNVAAELSAEHITISDSKKRSMGTIICDVIFNRIPKVTPVADGIDQCDLAIFFGPVWMGMVATPLRSYLKYLKIHPCKYAFVSISGGADHSNPKLMTELMRRTGTKPAAVIDLHIVDLLPKGLVPTRQDTSGYRLKADDIKVLTAKAVKEISKI
jgi:hypothetical protein